MFFIFFFLLGAVLGSFINVVLSRTDWYHGRSRCDNCGYTLKWYDLIPILSYICLLGKCRKCRKRISPDHLYAEVICGITAVGMYVAASGYEKLSRICIISGLLFMAIASVQDLKEKEIYTAVLYSGAITAGILKVIDVYLTLGGQEAIMTFLSVIGLKIMLSVFAYVFKDKIGGGDFDLLLVMYITLGGYGALYAGFFASFIGCIIYLPLILLKKHDRETPIPFAPLLLLGTVTYVILGGVLL